MTVIVVDASVLATALADDEGDGDRARARLSGQAIAAPEIIDLEVVSVLRRLVHAGKLPERRAALVLDDLLDLPLERARHAPLLRRCWDLRENLSPYDASYVALAEALNTTVLTADARLSRAVGPRCGIENIGAV